MVTEQTHTEQMTTEHPKLRVELWMRGCSPSTHDRQQAVLAQVQDIVENGSIDAFDINTWSKYITTAPTEYPDGTATVALDTIREFEAWAAQNDRTLQPGFRRREQPSLAPDTREVIAPPILCLAVYEEGTLRGVSPCSGPDRHRTIIDHLESLTPNDDS